MRRHLLLPLLRLQGPDKDSICFSLLSGDDVEEPVQAIGEVDVRVAGRAEHQGGALGRAPLIGAGMARLISDFRAVGVAVRFCLDNETAEPFSFEGADQPPAQQIAGNHARGPREE